MSELGDVEEDGEIDPRVKEELEVLNFASSEINKLEREINLARNKFRFLLNESSSKLNQLSKKLGKCVGKARAYYELIKDFRTAEDELNNATVNYQRANSFYRAAKETVALAEERMMSQVDGEKPQFDSAWQEMMNHATMKFTDAEKEKRRCEAEHQVAAAAFSAVSQKKRAVEKDIPRSINRAKPYFNLKDQLESRLQAERQSVEDLQRALTSAKETYKDSLKKLESISEEIHEKRRVNVLPPRTPGVGAEAEVTSPDSDISQDLLSINLDTHSVNSDAFPDESDVVSLSSQDLILDSTSPSPTDSYCVIGSSSLLTLTAKKSASGSNLFDVSDTSMFMTLPDQQPFSANISSNNKTDTDLTSKTSCLLTKPVTTDKDPLFAMLKETAVRPSFLNHKPPPPPGKTQLTSSDVTAKKLPFPVELIPSQTLSTTVHSTAILQQENGIPSENQNSAHSNINEYENLASQNNVLLSPTKSSLSSNSCRSDTSLGGNVETTASKSLSTSAQSSPVVRGRPRDKRVQKLNPSHFPILQSLTETSKRLSPKLPHGRPKGHEVNMHHHSPSPVRKTNGYFVYPEPRIRSRSEIGREAALGPNLFPDSDTSLFEKKPALHNSKKMENVNGFGNKKESPRLIEGNLNSQVYESHSKNESSSLSAKTKKIVGKNSLPNDENKTRNSNYSMQENDVHVGSDQIVDTPRNEGQEKCNAKTVDPTLVNGIKNSNSNSSVAGKLVYHL